MEHQEWSRKERQLWDAMMSPKRRRIALHGLSGGKRTKAITKNHELAEKEFAAGWAAFRAWIEH